MEGVGSRLSRASSHYGSTPMLTGPERRWHKQWVQVSSSYNCTTNFNSRGSQNNLCDIRLRRWTHVPPSHSTTDERPRRKLPYTPGSDKCEATIRDLNLKDYDVDHGSDRSIKEVDG
ncbi:uncharacterized protein LOC112506373 [Cynara cardunculus var. scolymus]|uniref:uncharacterized protein LOC112506373 n=1 Tax=Cynara cardunculus var. scolymus TaxID=59895 RepID=UPI000D62EFE8|nr:uncharacterized protein LOC112506373 [Cynara cardunculus var. scolymus]